MKYRKSPNRNRVAGWRRLIDEVEGEWLKNSFKYRSFKHVIDDLLYVLAEKSAFRAHRAPRPFSKGQRPWPMNRLLWSRSFMRSLRHLTQAIMPVEKMNPLLLDNAKESGCEDIIGSLRHVHHPKPCMRSWNSRSRTQFILSILWSTIEWNMSYLGALEVLAVRSAFRRQGHRSGSGPHKQSPESQHYWSEASRWWFCPCVSFHSYSPPLYCWTPLTLLL